MRDPISLNDTAADQLLTDPLAGLPLIPTRRSPAMFAGSRVDGGHIAFDCIDWSIQTEGGDVTGVSHESVERAYIAILRRFRSGLPSILIPLSELVDVPGVNARRTGGQYRQTRSALEYLTRVRLGPTGERVALRWDEIRRSTTGAGPAGGTMVAIELAPQFVERMQDASVVRLDRRLLTHLRPGLEQGLYRMVCRLQGEGATRVPALEVFQRLGSVQTDVRPARVRQMLGKAHATLVRLGVLAESPEPFTESGTTYLEYRAAEVIEGMEATVLLTEITQAFGVSPHGASSLVADHVDGLERTLAAAVLGILLPRKALPAMIVHYARKGDAIPDKGRRFLPEHPGQVAVGAEEGDAVYLAGAARECARRAEGDPRLSAGVLARLARQWTERRIARGDESEPWMGEGLAMASLQRMLDLPTLSESHGPSCQ